MMETNTAQPTTYTQAPVPPPPPPPRKKSSLGFWITIIVLVMFLGVSVLLNFGLAAGMFASTLGSSFPATGDAVDEFPEFTETWSFGSGKAKVVRIEVEGAIMRESQGGLFSPPVDKIEEILSRVRAADNDPQVKGIIVEVNSPGGGVTPSDEIYMALMRFKETDKSRKVLVHMRDLAASGGYYVAMAGDYLMAEPTTIIGSIGVIMQSVNFQELATKIGIKDVTMKSGANKDLLNPFREVNPEQVAILQEMIDAMYDRFAGIVAESRGLDEGVLKELADGRVFTADGALKDGFIDGIGYWDDAVVKMAILMGEDDIKVIRYDRQATLFDAFAQMLNPISLPKMLESATPQNMYIWKP